MCGYCIEKAMIDLLDREMGSSAPLSEDQMSILLLDSHTQETGFPMHCLKHAREWDKELDILYVLHCRSLEEIATRPASATKGSPPHNALIKHYHAYKRFASSRLKRNDLENILPHPSWLILYDPDFIFSQTKWEELTSNPDLLAQCASLLERYYFWWLRGEGQQKNDLDQRMKKTGVLDPIEDITRDDWDLFYSLFPAVYFALVYLSRHGEDLNPVENIALTDVNGVPDFPGFDLWLQRKALACAVQVRGVTFLLNNLDWEMRPVLIYYAFLRFEFVRKKRGRIILGMRSLVKQRCVNDELEEEANKYMQKMYC